MSASARNIVAWVLQVLLAFAFISAGWSKVSDIDKTIDMFGKLGLPAWFAYLIGGAELLGGIGLLIPRLTRLAAGGLSIIMVGAIVMHATKIPGGLLPATGPKGFEPHGLPAVIFLLLLGVVLWLRRPAPVAA